VDPIVLSSEDDAVTPALRVRCSNYVIFLGVMCKFIVYTISFLTDKSIATTTADPTSDGSAQSGPDNFVLRGGRRHHSCETLKYVLLVILYVVNYNIILNRDFHRRCTGTRGPCNHLVWRNGEIRCPCGGTRHPRCPLGFRGGSMRCPCRGPTGRTRRSCG